MLAVSLYLWPHHPGVPGLFLAPKLTAQNVDCVIPQAVLRVDESVNFDWGLGAVTPLAADRVSARWEGLVRADPAASVAQVPCTLHPAPCTLHLERCTLNAAP